MMLTRGDRVFVDKASTVGGLEVGESKFLRGKFGEYISTVTYSKQPSYASEMNKVQAFDGTKKEEIEAIYNRFALQAEAQIRKARQSRMNDDVELNRFYLGEEAVEKGIADFVDSHNHAFGDVSLEHDVRVIEKGVLQRAIENIRKLNISN